MLLDREQHDLLEAELLGAGAALECVQPSPEDSENGARGAHPADNGKDARGAPARPSGPWEVYYDTAEYALTQRGWWLRELAGTWLLRMPVLVPAGQGGVTVDYEEVTDPACILERAGLVRHAQLLRSGAPRSVESLLAQAKVLPFARIHTVRSVFCLELHGVVGSTFSTLHAPTALGTDSGILEVTLDSARFDMKLAENSAVAELVFEHGAAAAQHLRAHVANLRLLAAAKGLDEAVAKASLAAVLRERGIERPATARGICPKLAAFLSTWRPGHLRALLHAGALTQP